VIGIGSLIVRVKVLRLLPDPIKKRMTEITLIIVNLSEVHSRKSGVRLKLEKSRTGADEEIGICSNEEQKGALLLGLGHQRTFHSTILRGASVKYSK